MRRFLIEKCGFTRRLVNKPCLFGFYYRTAQPHERCNTSLLCPLIYQLRKGSGAARWKSTFVFSFKVHSCFCCANSQFLEPLGAQEPFQVTFLIYCHLPMIPAPPLLFTLRYLLLLLLSAIGKKQKAKNQAPLLPDTYPPHFTYRGCLSHH